MSGNQRKAKSVINEQAERYIQQPQKSRAEGLLPLIALFVLLCSVTSLQGLCGNERMAFHCASRQLPRWQHVLRIFCIPSPPKGNHEAGKEGLNLAPSHLPGLNHINTHTHTHTYVEKQAGCRACHPLQSKSCLQAFCSLRSNGTYFCPLSLPVLSLRCESPPSRLHTLDVALFSHSLPLRLQREPMKESSVYSFSL
jgi:hypothetical protein